MVEIKKILLVGPPNTGKSTIKSVFFEMANPFVLLRNSLDPTRGVNSNIYSFFDLELSVFDLAGQENENWFNNEKNIFNYADLIICILDINSYLKNNIDFIEDLIKIITELKLIKCSLVILLHKKDLIEPIYAQHKYTAFERRIKNELKSDFDIQIYTTSIAKEYFFETFYIIAEIFSNLFEGIRSLESNSIIQEYKTDFKIILQYDDKKTHNLTDLFYDFSLSSKDAKPRLERLERLGFLTFFKNNQNFQLTERALFFKKGLEIKKNYDKERRINKILESLYFYSNLNQSK